MPEVTEDGVARRLRAAQRKHLDGEWAGAEALYREIILHGRNVAQTKFYLAYMLQQTGRLGEAREQLNQAIALEGRHAEWHFNLGIVLSRLGELAEAVAAYSRAADLDSSKYLYWTNLGAAHDAIGEAVSAEACFNRALSLDAACPDAYFLMSALLLKQRRFAEGGRFNNLGIVALPAQCESRIMLCQAYHELGRTAEAIDVLLRWQGEEPENPTPTHLLVAYQGDKAPEQCAAEYVERTFNDFAERFDDVLTRLSYAGPQLVQDWMATLGLAPASQSVLDLGCGTGMVGEVLLPHAARLVGVDLSEAMLLKARDKRCYDVLCRADMMEFLERRGERFDLIACMDVLVYVGRLDALMSLIGQALKPDGLLICSVEKLYSEVDEPFWLNVSGRYSHSEDYLCTVLEKTGLAIELIQDVEIRNESGRPVAGLFICARRR
jgi:predicted TPR repeat methyltransferase